ncbi:MAG TPA: cytochrome ubiquinol oxidase subunit I, partial [Aestuariivirga sp.]|nr:cytochrome ubiquinol oxidase subunit I [Aestuariivirga sp.]
LLTTAESAAPIAAPAVATSLVAFIIVYFFVFGAGTFYILRLCGKSPDSVDPGIQGPSHAAGITPGPALKANE